MLWIFLSGGGAVVEYTGESYATVFHDFQLYRLITYGYTQTAGWHLLANIFGLWYVSLYLEEKIGTIRFILVYHIGLIIAGAILLVIYPGGFHYGASPAIFACLGMLANWVIRNKELWVEYKSQKGFYFLMYYLLLSNILGVRTFVFHFLGFAVGFLLGYVIKENQIPHRKPVFSLLKSWSAQLHRDCAVQTVHREPPRLNPRRRNRSAHRCQNGYRFPQGSDRTVPPPG